MLRCTLAFLVGLALASSAARAEDVRRPAPEFAVLMPNSGQILLSQLRGKVVLMTFVFTTCPHCQHMTGVLNKIYKDLGPRGFEPVAVAFNPMANMLVPDFVKQGSLTFPVGWSERDAVLSFLQQNPDYRFLVPQLVFIDRKGTIRLRVTGGDPFFGNDEEKALRAEIEKLLAEPAAPAKAMHSRSRSKTAGGGHKAAGRASL